MYLAGAPPSLCGGWPSRRSNVVGRGCGRLNASRQQQPSRGAYGKEGRFKQDEPRRGGRGGGGGGGRGGGRGNTTNTNYGAGRDRGVSSSAADAPERRKNAALYSTLHADGAPMPPHQHAVEGSTGTFRDEDAAQQTALDGWRRLKSRPEVLAPAGGWPQLRAAVECGADAVYFGCSGGFNARARAANFAADELPDVMDYLHARGLQGYLALNVLVFDEELPRLEALLCAAAAAGVDALIVQDVGAVELARRVAPNLPLHGSTQMSITSAEGADFAAARGVTRVVVGRELSVPEIARVAGGVTAAGGVEVEAFCHGALCVSYSGQCFSSEAWGGRSANRGQCAQACRMPYGLIVDGALRDLADASYLLSPQDLMALPLVPAMVDAGVGCFKIEGRLKGPEYVAATTAAYRAAVDATWSDVLTRQRQEEETAAASTASAAPATTTMRRYEASEEQLAELRQVFARGQDEAFDGLTPGFLEGTRHQRLVRGRAPRHRGLCVGRVAEVLPPPPPQHQGGRGGASSSARGGGRGGGGRGSGDGRGGTEAGVGLRVVVECLLTPVKRGDGLVFDAGTPERDEVGGAVWDVADGTTGARFTDGAPAGAARVVLTFGGGGSGGSRTRDVAPGQLLWKTRDHEVEARLRSRYEGLAAAATRKVRVRVAVSGALGAPLVVALRDADGREGVGTSGAVALAAAAARPMDAADVEKALGQLGDNTLEPDGAFDLSGLDLAAGLFLPASALKAARREAADALLRARLQHTRADGLTPPDSAPVLPAMLAEVRARRAANNSTVSPVDAAATGTKSTPLLRVLCRTRAQVDAALELPWLSEVILDFLEAHGLRDAVAAVRAAGRVAVVATPRVLKPDEQRLLSFYADDLGADALLLRGAGALQQLTVGRRGGGDDYDNAASAPSLRLEGDFSFNAANALAADLLLSAGLSRLAPTHDLNAAQLAALARALGPAGAANIEVICHQKLAIFHTEHCVFARFMSGGNSFKDCGKPCERHAVHLRDHAGADHLLLADMGCRNTLFNAQAQSAAHYLSTLAAAGVGALRVELVDEAPEHVAPLLQGYKDVLEGAKQPGELWAWLKRVPDANGRSHGVGAGSLAPTVERLPKELRPTARR